MENEPTQELKDPESIENEPVEKPKTELTEEELAQLYKDSKEDYQHSWQETHNK